MQAGAGLIQNGGAQAGTLTLDSSVAGNSSFSGTIEDGGAGALALGKTGAGTLTLSGANTYSGGTTINAGTLAIGAGGSLASTGAVTLGGPGTVFDISAGGNQTIGSLAGVAVSTVKLGGNTLTLGDISDTTFAGSISGTGGLIKQGAGTLTLSGANTYSGGTMINAGTLAIGAGGSLAPTGAMTLATSGTVFDISVGGNQTISSLAGAAGSNVTLGGNTLALGGVSDTAFDGIISGTGGLVKNGAGVQTLGGANTFNGGVTLNSGGLIVGNDKALGAGVLTVNGAASLAGAGGPSLNNNIILNNTLSFGGAGALTLDGTISGIGALRLDGGPLLKLNGANSYSGGTTISSGTLSVGNDGALGTGNVYAYGGTIDIQNGVTLSKDISIGSTFGLNVATGATGTYAGKLDNSLGDPAFLVKTGGGTLILTDGNAPDLGAILSEGTVRTNVAGALGNAEITLDGGTLQAGATMTLSNRGIFMNAAGGTIDTNGYNLTFNGPIRDSGGSGQLTKTGAGTFLLGGVSTYRGPTRISAGTLAAALPNAFSANSAMTVDAGATLDLSGLPQTIGSLAGDGLVTNSGASTARLTTNGDDTSTSFSGVIEDGAGVVSLTKTGAGTLILSGANTFTGGTTVSNGTLRNAGTVGVVQNAAGATFVNAQGATAGAVTNAGTATNAGTIASLDNSGGTFHLADGTIIGTATLTGGTLKGVGTLGGLTVGTGATVTPGNSIGTLNVAGNVAFNAGSTYLVETDPTGTSSDLIHATGTASLTGGTVEHIGLTGAYQLRSIYTILTADGGVSGKFDGATSVFAFLDPTLSYDANNVHLGFVRNDVDFSAAGRTPNQKATAAAIDSIGINAANPLYDAVALLRNDPGLIAGTFDQLSGEIHASAKGALIEDSRFLRDAASERIRSAFGAAGAADMLVMGYRDDGKLAMIDGADDRGQGPAFWTKAHGAWGSAGSDGNAAQLEQFWTDVVFGADTAIADDWRLGVLAGYGRTGFAANDRNSSGASDNYHLGAYGGGRIGDLGLSAGANYTWHNIATERRPAFAGFVDQPVGNYHAGTFQAFAEAGYQIDMQGIMFEPFANLAHVSLNTQGIREVGGAAALHAGSQTSNVTFTTLGLRASTAIALGTGTANLHGMVGWRHAFGDTTPQAVQAFAQGNAFTVLGTPIARDAALVEAGLDFELTPNASFGLSYNGQIAADASQHSFSAKLGVRF